MPDDALALLEVIGLRPVMIENLGWDVLLLPQHGLVLLDVEALRVDPEGTSTWILGAAASSLA